MKKFLAIILALAMIMAVSAVALADDAKPGEGITIGVVYKQSGNAYFQAGVEGFQKAADELGFEFMHDGPEDSSNDGQERIIRNYIDQGVDVLCISANDAAGLVDVCKEAMIVELTGNQDKIDTFNESYRKWKKGGRKGAPPRLRAYSDMAGEGLQPVLNDYLYV